MRAVLLGGADGHDGQLAHRAAATSGLVRDTSAHRGAGRRRPRGPRAAGRADARRPAGRARAGQRLCRGGVRRRLDRGAHARRPGGPPVAGSGSRHGHRSIGVVCAAALVVAALWLEYVCRVPPGPPRTTRSEGSRLGLQGPGGLGDRSVDRAAEGLVQRLRGEHARGSGRRRAPRPSPRRAAASGQRGLERRVRRHPGLHPAGRWSRPCPTPARSADSQPCRCPASSRTTAHRAPLRSMAARASASAVRGARRAAARGPRRRSPVTASRLKPAVGADEVGHEVVGRAAQQRGRAWRTARVARPGSDTAIRSPSRTASSMSCVTNTIVLRTVVLQPQELDCSARRTIGSTAPNGSSMSSTGGSAASARATPTRWR